MKFLFAFLFVVVSSIGFSQDKTNIPPGPIDPGSEISEATDPRIIKMQKKDFVRLEKDFIKKVNIQKSKCAKNKEVHKEKNLLSLYLVSVFKDSTYQPCLPCGDKASDFKHHPDVQCLFKNKEIIRSLSDLLNHPGMNYVLLERKSTQESFGDMIIYYGQILKDYAY
jgi:hypothetical protein